MKKDETTNLVVRQMIDIAQLASSEYFIELKTRCPFCRARKMLLKEQGTKYWCMSCGREGSLDELEFELLRRLASRKEGVAL